MSFPAVTKGGIISQVFWRKAGDDFETLKVIEYIYNVRAGIVGEVLDSLTEKFSQALSKKGIILLKNEVLFRVTTQDIDNGGECWYIVINHNEYDRF